jgi:hypothetical protein
MLQGCYCHLERRDAEGGLWFSEHVLDGSLEMKQPREKTIKENLKNESYFLLMLGNLESALDMKIEFFFTTSSHVQKMR